MSNILIEDRKKAIDYVLGKAHIKFNSFGLVFTFEDKYSMKMLWSEVKDLGVDSEKQKELFYFTVETAVESIIYGQKVNIKKVKKKDLYEQIMEHIYFSISHLDNMKYNFESNSRKRDSRKGKLTAEERQLVVKGYLEGKKQSQLAEEFGVKQASISIILKEATGGKGARKAKEELQNSRVVKISRAIKEFLNI